MLREGIIRHSTSPWAAPIAVAPKPDGKGSKPAYRFAIDYKN